MGTWHSSMTSWKRIAMTMYTGYELPSSVNVSMQLHLNLSSSHLSSIELILIVQESGTVRFVT